MTKRKNWIVTDPHGIARCWWCVGDDLYIRYHDQEWGFPTADDTRLFEKICLEGFQSGLSWLTILRKRENFRRAFHEFDIERIARFTKRDVDRLLNDAGIVRHRGKIESTINNAKRARKLIDEFGSLAAYVWRFAPDFNSTRAHRTGRTIAPQAPESAALSKDLRRRGWFFVGPTTIYAFMQAGGMVNDHLDRCRTFEAVREAQTRFRRPG